MLLVEDNEEVAASTEALLSMMGHQVTYVFNTDTAVGILEAARDRASSSKNFPFDVVLSDIHMPGKLNGIDLAELLERFEPRIPMILVTGYAEEFDRARQVDARVLSKPFDIALLDSLLCGISDGTPIERNQAARSIGRGSIFSLQLYKKAIHLMAMRFAQSHGRPRHARCLILSTYITR